MGLVGGILGGAGGALSSLLSSGSGSSGSRGASMPRPNEGSANSAPGVPAGLPAAAPAPMAASVGSPSELSGARSVPEPVRPSGGTAVDEGAIRVDFGAMPVRGMEDGGRAYALAAQAAERQASLISGIGNPAEAPVGPSERGGASAAVANRAGEVRSALDTLVL